MSVKTKTLRYRAPVAKMTAAIAQTPSMVDPMLGIVTIPLSKIVVDKERNTRRGQLGDLDELSREIGVDGQKNPVEVTPAGEDGKHFLVSGFRRVAAIQKLKRERGLDDYAVLARVTSDERSEQDWANLVENLHRKDLTGFDRAFGFVRQIERHGWKPADIAKRYGVSKDDLGKSDKGEAKGEPVKGMSVSNITNLVTAYHKASDSLKEKWASGRVSNEVVFKLAIGGFSHSDQDKLVTLCAGKSGQALEEAITEALRADGTIIAPPKVAAKASRAGSKPSGKTVEQAIAWADESAAGTDNASVSAIWTAVSAALAWAYGDGKTLSIAGKTFKAPVKAKGKSKGKSKGKAKGKNKGESKGSK